MEFCRARATISTPWARSTCSTSTMTRSSRSCGLATHGVDVGHHSQALRQGGGEPNPENVEGDPVDVGGTPDAPEPGGVACRVVDGCPRVGERKERPLGGRGSRGHEDGGKYPWPPAAESEQDRECDVDEKAGGLYQLLAAETFVDASPGEDLRPEPEDRGGHGAPQSQRGQGSQTPLHTKDYIGRATAAPRVRPSPGAGL